MNFLVLKNEGNKSMDVGEYRISLISMIMISLFCAQSSSCIAIYRSPLWQ